MRRDHLAISRVHRCLFFLSSIVPIVFFFPFQFQQTLLNNNNIQAILVSLKAVITLNHILLRNNVHFIFGY